MTNTGDFLIENGVVKKYYGEERRVVIPDGVREISGEVFFPRRESIRSVVIPEGVTIIGKNAFRGCAELAEVKLPQSLRALGEGAFYGCSALRTVELPDGLREIGESAFSDCISLTQIRLPDGVTRIGEGAFWYDQQLKRVHIPDSVTQIGENAFAGCAALEEVSIPEGCSVGKAAFAGCRSPADEKGLLLLGSRLCGCFTGKSRANVVIPDTVEAIEAGVFHGWRTVYHLEMSLHCPAWDATGVARAYGFAMSLLNKHGSQISFRDESGKIVARVILAVEGETEAVENAAVLAIRQKDRAFDFAGYDVSWGKLKQVSNKTRVALVRLQYPYALDEEMRRTYERFLTGHSLNTGKMLIDEEETELLSMLLEKRLLGKSVLPELVDYASLRGKTVLTALLLAAQAALRKKAPNEG